MARTPEQRQRHWDRMPREWQAAEVERVNRWRASLTPEQRAAYLARQRERWAEKIAAMSAEELALHRKIMSERARAFRARRAAERSSGAVIRERSSQPPAVIRQPPSEALASPGAVIREPSSEPSSGSRHPGSAQASWSDLAGAWAARDAAAALARAQRDRPARACEECGAPVAALRRWCSHRCRWSAWQAAHPHGVAADLSL